MKAVALKECSAKEKIAPSAFRPPTVFYNHAAGLINRAAQRISGQIQDIVCQQTHRTANIGLSRPLRLYRLLINQVLSQNRLDRGAQQISGHLQDMTHASQMWTDTPPAS